MRDLIIIGAGGFGREAMEIALDIQEDNPNIGWRMRGFITDIPGDFYDKNTLGYDIIDDISHHEVQKNAVYVFAIADISFRERMTKHFLNAGAKFVNLIHPSAIIGRTVVMGVGNIISPRVTITCNVDMGNFIRIGGGTSIGHDVKIGDYATISGTCGINGYAEIGRGAFVGSHGVICPHAVVGEYATVGTGSVVLRSVKPHISVYGNPAKKLNL